MVVVEYDSLESPESQLQKTGNKSAEVTSRSPSNARYPGAIPLQLGELRCRDRLVDIMSSFLESLPDKMFTDMVGVQVLPRSMKLFSLLVVADEIEVGFGLPLFLLV